MIPCSLRISSLISFVSFPFRRFPPLFLLERMRGIVSGSRGITRVPRFLFNQTSSTNISMVSEARINSHNERPEGVEAALWILNPSPERRGRLGLISWRIFLRYTQQIPNPVSKVARYNANGIPPSHWKFLNAHIRTAEMIIWKFLQWKIAAASSLHEKWKLYSVT